MPSKICSWCVRDLSNVNYLTPKVPLWITNFFADGYGVAIPTRQLFQSLLLTLIVPLFLGKYE
ncbi:putative sodium/metabolite cotransporter BASS4 chloroplastic [Bienertia sinuspersici]